MCLNPNLPHGWVDGPPSSSRISRIPVAPSRRFSPIAFTIIPVQLRVSHYTIYQVDLSESDLDRLLTDAQTPDVASICLLCRFPFA
jgi:hypothetical protein